MTVIEWADAFFNALSGRLGGQPIPYSETADGHVLADYRDGQIQIVGCNDCFMSVWLLGGLGVGTPDWDGDSGLDSAEDGAAEIARILWTTAHGADDVGWMKINEKITLYRERVGLTEDDVKDAMGITDSSYDDLEAYEDEFMHLCTVREAVKLSKLLRFDLQALIAPVTTPEHAEEATADVSFGQLIKHARIGHGLSEEELEKQAYLSEGKINTRLASIAGRKPQQSTESAASEAGRAFYGGSCVLKGPLRDDS